MEKKIKKRKKSYGLQNWKKKIKRKDARSLKKKNEDRSLDIGLKDRSHLSFNFPYHDFLMFAYPFYRFFDLVIHP